LPPGAGGDKRLRPKSLVEQSPGPADPPPPESRLQNTDFVPLVLISVRTRSPSSATGSRPPPLVPVVRGLAPGTFPSPSAHRQTGIALFRYSRTPPLNELGFVKVSPLHTDDDSHEFLLVPP